MSEITVSFPGGKKVDAQVGRHLVRTDQPERAGGEDSAPAPFDYFLASLASCAGLYVLGFCQSRGLPTDGIVLHQRTVRDPGTHALQRIEISIEVPPSFPAKYLDALVRAADQCAVKKVMVAQPDISVRASVIGGNPVVAA